MGKVSFLLLISSILACIVFANYLYFISRSGLTLNYNQWTVIDDNEVIIFNKRDVGDDYLNKTEQAEAHCNVIGMDLLNNRPTILKDIIHKTRLESFIVPTEDAGCAVVGMASGELEEKSSNCSEGHDFACIRQRSYNEVAIGGFGGRKAKEAEWPFFVRIVVRGRLICGGSIFGPYGIVTAAHCLEKLNGRFRVEIEGGVRGRGPLVLNEYYPKKILMHPHFSSSDKSYDSRSSAVHNDIGLILSECLARYDDQFGLTFYHF